MSMQSAEIKDLATALTNVQASLTGALKDASNPYFKSKYADLESVWAACRALLTQNKLCVIQTTDTDERGDYLVTTLAHSSGQWMKGRLRLAPVKQDPQAIGSAITYARRYALAAIVGIVQVDDDGNAASGKEDPAVKTHAPVEPSKLVAKAKAVKAQKEEEFV